MSKPRTGLIAVVGALALIGGVAAVGLTRQGQAGNATAVLGLVTGTAVGVERTLELFWSIMGQLLHAWWPLNVPAKQLSKFVIDLGSDVTPIISRARDAIAKGAKGAGDVDIGAVLDGLEKRVREISAGAPPTQAEAASMITAIDRLRSLDPADPGLQNAARTAKNLIADLSSFADTFADNPGRRIVSLYMGALLGLSIAWIGGLDLFMASGIESTSIGAFDWGVAVTGLVIGLGANPTHEVIKAVQEFKNTQRAQAKTMTRAR